jgi:hypothetical protein
LIKDINVKLEHFLDDKIAVEANAPEKIDKKE